MPNHLRTSAARSIVLAGTLCAVAATVPLTAPAAPPDEGDRGRSVAGPLPPGPQALDAVRLPAVQIPSVTAAELLEPLGLPATGTPLDQLLAGGRSATAAPAQPVSPAGVAPVVRIGTPALARGGQSRSPVTTGSPRGSGRRRSAARHRGDAAAPAAVTPRAAPAGDTGAAPDQAVVDPDRAPERPLEAISPGLALPAALPDWTKPLLAGLVLLALYLSLRSLVTGARARRLERQRELLQSHVGMLQRALVPELPERLGDVSLSAAYSPAEAPGAGGDFYDAFALPHGRVGVILGDVEGHGRGALERAALMRYGVRAYVEAGFEPRAALKLAGRVAGEDPQDRFTTVAVAVFDETATQMTYALAGHPPPLLLGPALRQPLSGFASPPLGLGLATGLRQTTISLPAGAVACFFTDGLVEARAGGVMVGRERLERLLLTLDTGPDAATALLESLRQRVDRVADDMAICVMRPAGSAASDPLQVEELELEAGEPVTETVADFLTVCGVAAHEIAPALVAAETADCGAGVVIRVRLGAGGAAVEAHGLEPPLDVPLLAGVR